MGNTFPRTKRSVLGYDVDQVEEFLRGARVAYDAVADEDPMLTAKTIRHTAFAMRKGGYSPRHVDAAMERLEDAFAERERERSTARLGVEGHRNIARRDAQVILDRLLRPDDERFRRSGLLTTGYRRPEVDAFARRIVSYLQDGVELTVDEVRTVVFSPERGGYDETQVDLVLDGVIDVMLAVR